jgi:hypothetical protein
VVGFHNRSTLLNTNTVKLYGAMLGLQYKEMLRLHVGIYGFGPENKTVLINSPEFTFDTVAKFTSMSYLSVGMEYTWLQRGRFSFSYPIQFGFGGLFTEYFNNNARIERRDRFLFPIEVGISSYFEIFKWLGIKGGAGYRLNIGNRQVVQLSSPYYHFGLSLLVAVLYRDIKGRL